jgi:hypothetical protein
MLKDIKLLQARLSDVDLLSSLHDRETLTVLLEFQQNNNLRIYFIVIYLFSNW